MAPDGNPLPLNLVLLTGRILRRSDLSLTSLRVSVITLVIGNPDTDALTSGGVPGAMGELSVELWGDLAKENDSRLKPGDLVFVQAQVAGRQKQDSRTKLVHHWMVLKAKGIQILAKSLEDGGK